MNYRLLLTIVVLASPGVMRYQLPVSITVEPAISSGPINPYLFGLNTARWDESLFPERSEEMILTCDRDAVKKIRAAGITLLKYPGGNDADAYVWNAPNNNPSEMDTDEYIALCRAVGAEPFITVNFNEPPSLAAEWVRYCNLERGYNVKLWEIGDEQWGTWAKGHAPPEVYAEKFRMFVRAMKAIDPGILVATNVPLGSHPENWTERVLRAAGDAINMLTFTFFPQQWGREDDDTLIASIDTFRRQVVALQREIGRVVGPERAKEITLVNVGYNSVNHSPGPQTLKMVNAVWTAAMMGTMAETGVDMACFWALHNAFPPRQGDYGILSSEGNNIPSYSYYVFPLLSDRLRGESVQVRSADPHVRAFAARSGKRVNLVLLNCSPDVVETVAVSLRDYTPNPSVCAWVLDEKRRYEQMDPLCFDRGELRCALSPYSITALEFIGRDSITAAVNLALSAIATSSSYSVIGPNFGPGSAIDGKLHTRWNSAAWTKSGGDEAQWFQLAWEDTIQVSRVKVLWGESPAIAYRIECSLDGVQWTRVKDVFFGKGGEDVFEFGSMPMRYLRLSGTRGSKGISAYSIREIEVF